MDSSTQTALNKALEMMDIPTAVQIIAAQISPVNRVAFFLDLQTVTTPAAQVHICLQHLQAVQS